MATPEGKVKKKVIEVLKSFGDECWYFMPVQTGYGVQALDFIVCLRGRFFGLETKAKGKSLTPRQLDTARAIVAAGGQVLRVTEDNVHMLEPTLLLFVGGVQA
jgi:hypothetical protein